MDILGRRKNDLALVLNLVQQRCAESSIRYVSLSIIDFFLASCSVRVRTPRHAGRLAEPVEKIRLVLARCTRREKPNKVGSGKGKTAQFWGHADQKALR